MYEQYGHSKVERRSASVAPPWSTLVRWTVGILLIGHGLIHVLGPLEIWGLADIETLTGDPSIDIGSAATEAIALAWLGALVILVVAGAAVIAQRPWWRALAIIGVLVSQATIFVQGTGRWGLWPFGGEFTSHATFDGVTIPEAGSLGWHFGTDRWDEGEFFRYRITGLSLHPG